MVAAQTQIELTLTVRRGESVLVTLVIPAALLFFFGSVAVLPTDGRPPVDFLLPGMLGLAVMSTAMVSLGIATGFERYYHVLKRLGGTPLPRWGLLVGKLGAVLAVEAIQVLVLLAIAVLALGWRPTGDWLIALLSLVLGTAAFGGLGLTLAGALRAEATLAVANGLYLVFLLLGGMVVPLSALPSWLATVAHLLPAAALSDVLRSSLGAAPTVPTGSVVVLACWAIAMPVVAARAFRWD